MTQQLNPARIEDDLEATQARIESRLDALQSSLAPHRLLQSMLPEAADGRLSVDDMLALAQRNLPAAVLTAGGLLWLSRDLTRNNGAGGPDRGDKGLARRAEERMTSMKRDLKHNLDEATEQARRAGRAASDMAVDASDALHDAADRAGEIIQAVPTQMQRAGSAGTRWVRDNPLAAGLAFAAAGALLGSLFAARSNGDAATAVQRRAGTTARKAAGATATKARKAASSARKGAKTKAAAARRTAASAASKAESAVRSARSEAADAINPSPSAGTSGS